MQLLLSWDASDTSWRRPQGANQRGPSVGRKVAKLAYIRMTQNGNWRRFGVFFICIYFLFFLSWSALSPWLGWELLQCFWSALIIQGHRRNRIGLELIVKDPWIDYFCIPLQPDAQRCRNTNNEIPLQNFREPCQRLLPPFRFVFCLHSLLI